MRSQVEIGSHLGYHGIPIRQRDNITVFVELAGVSVVLTRSFAVDMIVAFGYAALNLAIAMGD